MNVERALIAVAWLLVIAICLVVAMIVTGCAQYESVYYLKTEPVVQENPAPAPDTNDDIWWQALLTAPVEVVSAVADAPVAIIHELGNLAKTVAGAVVDVETGRVREIATWTRFTLNREEPIQWLDTIETDKLKGGQFPDEVTTQE